MSGFSTITPRYDASEDRLLIALNVGQEGEWACWLTRRMVLTALAALRRYLAKSSPVAARASFEYRGDVAAMERAAAYTKTRKSISQTPNEKLTSVKHTGELAVHFSLRPQGDSFLFRLRGRAGGEAHGLLARAELQTLLVIIETETLQAGWMSPPAAAMTQGIDSDDGKQSLAAAKKRVVN
jgi:hypothetical protein